MKEDLEYRLEDPEVETPSLEKQNSKKKIIIIIIISIIVLISIGLIIFFVLRKKGKEDKTEEEQGEKIGEFYFYANISTSDKGHIRNSFKKGSENYIEEIGDLNNGKDYEENERDNFDLCIPNKSTKNLTNYKTIFLSIHGGGWIEGIKENALEMCKAFESSGFLIATMSYTLLNGYYKEYNIFRIIDEITAVLEKLKQFLINKGYDENKLELIMQGGSAGAHLSLLYSYMIKNPPIPIKFIVNIVGPVTLDPDYWLAIKPDEDPLENIEFKDIENAINNDKIVQMNGTYNNVSIDNVILVYFMNSWLGRNGSSDLDEIFSDLNTKEINKTNEKYQELLRKTSYGYPINYVSKESIPTLCLYGGKDANIGVVHYSKLKEEFNKNHNNNITLVYSRYGNHYIFDDKSEYGIKALEQYKKDFIDYCQKYLNSFKYNNES